MVNINAGVCVGRRRVALVGGGRHCERQKRRAWRPEAIKIVFWRQPHVCRLYFPFLWPNAALSGQLHLHCDAHGVPVSQLSHVFSLLLSLSLSLSLSLRRPCFSLVSPFRLSSFLFPRQLPLFHATFPAVQPLSDAPFSRKIAWHSLLIRRSTTHRWHYFCLKFASTRQIGCPIISKNMLILAFPLFTTLADFSAKPRWYVLSG